MANSDQWTLVAKQTNRYLYANGNPELYETQGVVTDGNQVWHIGTILTAFKAAVWRQPDQRDLANADDLINGVDLDA